MFVSFEDLDRLSAMAFRSVSKRLEDAAKVYEGSRASFVLRREAEKLAEQARKLEKRNE